MTTLRVRPATPDDLALILSLIRELAEYERALDEVVATEDTLRRHLFGEGIGRGAPAECVIGEVDDESQGFALFFLNFSTWLAAPGLYLEDLFVRPVARAKGLGKALLSELARLGIGRFGQLGDETATQREALSPVVGITDAVEIAAGSSHV